MALLRDEPYDLEAARALVPLERAESGSQERAERLVARIARFEPGEPLSARGAVGARVPRRDGTEPGADG